MSGLYINDYQLKAFEFAIFENQLYPFLALSEEVGEVNAVVAKALRKGRTPEGLTVAERVKLEGELGDAFWQLCACCTVLGVRLDDIAEANIVKLTNRRAVGEIGYGATEERRNG